MDKGLWYRLAPEFAQSALVSKGQGVGKVMKTGRVVYVHPKERFVTLAFKGEKGWARECFRPEELGMPVPAPRKS